MDNLIVTISGIVLILAFIVASVVLFITKSKQMKNFKKQFENGEINLDELRKAEEEGYKLRKIFFYIFMGIVLIAAILYTIFGEGSQAIQNHEWFKPPWQN